MCTRESPCMHDACLVPASRMLGECMVSAVCVLRACMVRVHSAYLVRASCVSSIAIHFAMPQPCKPIGYARGVHKQGGFQTANGNLPLKIRFAEQYIHLPVLARNSTCKKHGMARVVCGVDKSGKKHDEQCFARDLHELYDGVRCQIADDRTGGTRWIKIRWFFIVLCADMLGANALLPYMETPGASLCCSGCNWDQSQPDAHKPFSFFRGGRKRKCWEQRDWELEKLELERLRTLPTTQAKKVCRPRHCRPRHCRSRHRRSRLPPHQHHHRHRVISCQEKVSTSCTARLST